MLHVITNQELVKKKNATSLKRKKINYDFKIFQ